MWQFGGVVELRNAVGVDLARSIDQTPAHVVFISANKGVRLNGVAKGILLPEELFRRAYAPEVNGLRRAGLRRQPQCLKRIMQRRCVAVIGGVADM